MSRSRPTPAPGTPQVFMSLLNFPALQHWHLVLAHCSQPETWKSQAPYWKPSKSTADDFEFPHLNGHYKGATDQSSPSLWQMGPEGPGTPEGSTRGQRLGEGWHRSRSPHGQQQALLTLSPLAGLSRAGSPQGCSQGASPQLPGPQSSQDVPGQSWPQAASGISFLLEGG